MTSSNMVPACHRQPWPRNDLCKCDLAWEVIDLCKEHICMQRDCLSTCFHSAMLSCPVQYTRLLSGSILYCLLCRECILFERGQSFIPHRASSLDCHDKGSQI